MLMESPTTPFTAGSFVGNSIIAIIFFPPSQLSSIVTGLVLRSCLLRISSHFLTSLNFQMLDTLISNYSVQFHSELFSLLIPGSVTHLALKHIGMQLSVQCSSLTTSK